MENDKNELKISNHTRQVIINKVDDFCAGCRYLHPGTEDPCRGCKMQEFVDSLCEKKQEESQNKTWKVTISEHRELDITVAAKSRHDAEGIAELVSDMGMIDTLDGDVRWSYRAVEADIPTENADFSTKNVK